LRFFIDNNLSVKHARGLHGFVSPEHEVLHLQDEFPASTTDVDWMMAIAEQDSLFVITGDVRISRNPHEIKAWLESGKTVFFLKSGWTNIGFWDQAKKLIHYFQEIEKMSKRYPNGAGFLVPVKGAKFERIGV